MTATAYDEADLAPPWTPDLHLDTQQIPFWDRLREEERRALASAAHSEWHPAGTLICSEGSHGDSLYIVESGCVAVLKDVGQSQPITLGTRGPGEILGEMSLIGEQTRSASLAVIQHGRLLRITAADFTALMNEHRGISWAVLNVLNDRLQEADAARSLKAREREALTRAIEHLSDETRRLTELADARQETIELLVHDLRTPLAVVNGCIEILESSVPETERAILEMAQRNNQRVLNMLDQLLETSRADSPEQAAVRQPVDLAQLLSEAVADAHTAAERAAIDLVLAPSPPLPTLHADAAALRRVLDNLLGNALAYTPAGGRVTVAATSHGPADRSAGAHDTIGVSVTDTGPGVPAEHRERIFERFVRLPGTGGHRRGFGLGLYYCRQTIEAHGGRIWVEPGPNDTGSRFSFLLTVGSPTHD
ncbi:MAG: cyclic nucleotide-binding domain-containing protein [Anaerolineae bacterium]|nr:cyclic nucleotide-binding domain-containing protein [Anaerolineae bacterium]